MSKPNQAFSISRRQLLGGSVALAALSALPALAISATNLVRSVPSLWLGRLDDSTGRWHPVALACTYEKTAAAPLRLVVRGPWALAGLPPTSLRVEALYRQAPDRPFLLSSGLRSAGQGGQVVHAGPTALAGLQVRLDEQTAPVPCPLTAASLPALATGRYAVLIDTATHPTPPDWRAIGLSDDGRLIHTGARSEPLAGLSLDIAPA